MIGPPATIAASWAELERVLGEAGYEMRRHKCKVWAPSRASGLSIGAEMRIALLTQLILESRDSLPLLGAAAEGKLCTVLGPFAAAAAPAMARVQKAEAVCEIFRRYVAAQPGEHTKQAAHTMLQKPVAMALYYDVRVSPQWVIEYVVERLRAAVLQTAAAIYEVGGLCWKSVPVCQAATGGGGGNSAVRQRSGVSICIWGL